MATRTIEDVTKTINDYAIILRNEGLSLKRIILFGSFSEGKQKNNSDIDIAVILKKYNKDRFTTRLELMKFCRIFDDVIEPHPFLDSEFDETDPFVSEILRTGIEVCS